MRGTRAREAAKDARNGSADAIIFLRVIATGGGNYRRFLTIVPLLRDAEDRRNIIGGRVLSPGTAANRKSRVLSHLSDENRELAEMSR